MKDYYVDLHIHIGYACRRPVKITASKSLTLKNILEECINRKGIEIIGIVDCGSPLVQKEIAELLEKGILVELSDGGFKYKDKVVIIPGSEVEATEYKGGNAHYLCFFPNLSMIKAFTQYMRKYIKNVNLSSQKGHLTFQELKIQTPTH